MKVYSPKTRKTTEFTNMIAAFKAVEKEAHLTMTATRHNYMIRRILSDGRYEILGYIFTK